jgi:hypothetical protein
VGRGRKREIVLEVDPKGKITVKKDSGMDVVLLHAETGTSEVLNPRDQLVLEEKGGTIRVKEAPPKTKMAVTKVGAPPAPADDTGGAQ